MYYFDVYGIKSQGVISFFKKVSTKKHSTTSFSRKGKAIINEKEKKKDKKKHQ